MVQDDVGHGRDPYIRGSPRQHRLNPSAVSTRCFSLKDSESAATLLAGTGLHPLMALRERPRSMVWLMVMSLGFSEVDGDVAGFRGM